jgi:hypothetical protein
MNIEPNETVVLVLLPDYGVKLRELCARAGVWVVDSPLNRNAAREIWDRLESGQLSPMTVFDWGPDEAPAETVLRMLDTIEEHHPYCVKIEVIGANVCPRLSAALRARGYFYDKPTSDGFVVSKQAL